ncbi:TPA: hypothetical protein ACNB44_002025 [Escherichia coli]
MHFNGFYIPTGTHPCGTSEIHEVVQEWLATGRGNLADLKEELWYYNLYINPSADELMNASRRYGLGHTTWLKDFISNAV